MKNYWPWNPLHIPNELEEMEYMNSISESELNNNNIFVQIINKIFSWIYDHRNSTNN